jgi:hypothetical protein
MPSILDNGFIQNMSGLASQVLIKDYVYPNLARILTACNSDGQLNNEAPQLLRVGDFKLLSAACYMDA